MKEKKVRGTWTWAEGEGWLKLSETEAIAHMRARIVTAKVSKALALYPNECIFRFFFSFSASFGFWVSLFVLLLQLRLVLGSVREKRVIGRNDMPFEGFLFCLLCQCRVCSLSRRVLCCYWTGHVLSTPHTCWCGFFNF